MSTNDTGFAVLQAPTQAATGPQPKNTRPTEGTDPPTYDQMSLKTYIFGALMVLLAILGTSVWLLAPYASPMLTVFLYSIPANCAISLFPHEPVLVDYGTAGLNIWGIALAATLGTLVAGFIDYKVFAPVLNLKRSADRYRDKNSYARANHWFYKTPFLTLAVAGFSPIPFFPFKFLVFASKYPLPKYLAALALGRFPRYCLLTLAGYHFNPPTSLVLATFGVMLLLVYFRKILELSRKLVLRLAGKANPKTAEQPDLKVYSAAMVFKSAVKAVRNIRSGRPLCVSLEVTHNCTANCLHCDKGPVVEDHPVGPDVYQKICQDLDPTLVQIAGGEPLMRDDLADIVRSVHRPGRPPFIAIITNGSLLTREKYLELRAAGANQFSISIDFPDARHDKWRRIPGLFGHLSELVPKLVAMGHGDIVLNACFHRANYRLLPEIAVLAKAGGTKLNLSPYTDLRTNNKTLNLRHPADTEELDEIITSLYAPGGGSETVMTSEVVMRRFNDFYKTGFTPGCQAGQRYLVVNPDGTMTPCAMHTKTRYHSQEELLEKFVKNNQCGECFISSRANTEKSFRELLTDNLRFVSMSKESGRRAG